MTAKKAAKSPKHKPATKKHAASAKHTQTKAQAAHLHQLHVEHVAHLAHLKATGQKVTVKAKPTAHAKAKKKVGFAVGDWLPVCGFEAVAQSLRLAGQFVHDDEVAGLWELAGADPLGASVAAALDAASLHGLAGFRPRWKQVAAPVTADHLALPLAQDEAVAVDPFEDFLAGEFHDLVLAVEQTGHLAAVGHVAVDDLAYEHVFDDLADDLAELAVGGRVGEYAERLDAAQLKAAVDLFDGTFGIHSLILQVDVPGPHAVLATRDGWWSWGELHSPWPARVEEAWAVSWS